MHVLIVWILKNFGMNFSQYTQDFHDYIFSDCFGP